MVKYSIECSGTFSSCHGCTNIVRAIIDVRNNLRRQTKLLSCVRLVVGAESVCGCGAAGTGCCWSCEPDTGCACLYRAVAPCTKEFVNLYRGVGWRQTADPWFTHIYCQSRFFRLGHLPGPALSLTPLAFSGPWHTCKVLNKFIFESR